MKHSVRKTKLPKCERIQINFLKFILTYLYYIRTTQTNLRYNKLLNLKSEIMKFTRSSCKSYGHRSIPIIRPIPSLTKSKTDLELMVKKYSIHQMLQPEINCICRNDSACTLQVSRRPSILLQDTLANKPDMFYHDGLNRNCLKHKHNSIREITSTMSSAALNFQNGVHKKSSEQHCDVGIKVFQAKQQKLTNRQMSNDALSSTLSATYCKLLVLLGFCFPISEVISEQIPIYVYQGFYIYLYVCGIFFVIFLYISAFRTRTLFTALKNYHEKNSNVHLKYKVKHYGSLYLRIGAIAFAIGTMVYSGLEFGHYFELNDNPDCHDIFVAAIPFFRTILCIIQVQFIFLNTTYLDMARHKVISRFGLMHMVATNLCEWLFVLVEEAKHEIFFIQNNIMDQTTNALSTNNDKSLLILLHTLNIKRQNETIKLKDSVSSLTDLKTKTPSAELAIFSSCSRTTIMGTLVQQLSPFLFPCTIEYSLICAVIIFEMWKAVKSISDINKSRKRSIKPAIQKRPNYLSVDCSQSHKGMFFGILIIVITIISMIMYFVLNDQPGYEQTAIREVTLWETMMYLFCGGAVIVGMILMRDLRYIKSNSEELHSMVLDNLLLIVAQTGIYLYAIFSIFGSYFAKWYKAPYRIEGIITEVLGLTETSLQTMFILHSSHQRCKGGRQVRRKPGREIVTFLIIANIAIWLINTLIKGRAVFKQTHLDFFGIWGWTIITHISMPLAIFYRFHSTICLFEIWKTTYKAKVY